MGDLSVPPRRPNGAVRPLEVAPSVASDGGDLRWTAVEEAAADVLRTIQPTLSSERKRARVISYIQRLLSCSLGCQVYPYGSVPLKTYLPDGDIDLTVLSKSSAEDALICDIFNILQQEELNEHADFEVKDVQLISAEVKLVKCLVQDIVVDISCNQLGGLCTLCFLEQIDRLVDNDHLFKRSVILIKAWCYYESRILGATHGLFSTYALEILVLYIFHIHHSSLKGPFSVLQRFLEYFSNFDWENYCVSLHGPVRKSSMPDIVVHTPEVCRHNRLLSKQFLMNSTTMFKVPPRDHGKQSRPFQQKFINIIDPLKDDNNLGRSVNQGNFYRIRSALKFGARKLGQILSLPTESTRRELKNFFANVLARHGGRLQASSLHSDSSSVSSFHSSDVDSSVGARSPGAETEGTSDSSSQGSDASSYQVDRSIQAIHLSEIPLEGAKWGGNLCGNSLLNSPSAIELNPECRGTEGPKTVVVLKSIDIVREPIKNSRASGNSPQLRNPFRRTHSVASGRIPSTGRISSGHQSWNLVDHNETSEPFDHFSDLTGDYESHLKSLLYGQSFHGIGTGTGTGIGTATVQPMVYNLPVWDMQCQTDFRQDGYFPMNPTHAIWEQPSPKVRGTGTYIPRTDLGSWKGGKLPVRKGRKRTQGSPTFQSYNQDHKFGVGMFTVQENVADQIYHHAEVPGSKRSTAYPSPVYAASNLHEQSEGFEFNTSVNLRGENDGPYERDDGPYERASIDSLDHELNPKAHAMLIPDQKLASTEGTLERAAGKSYQLKDEEDFPPLASQIPITRPASA
ncbi:hypothetical protein V2J09_018206 [Rumex salicifolius]